jgi:6-pyruvoyltetrahydropterin/6-carboxytetrahydropterin synthase
MWAIAISQDLVAQHHLVGGDWVEENHTHSHHYRVELQLEGGRLDRHGYLVDIVDLETKLDAQARHFTDRTLNDLPEFAGANPGIERFAFVMCDILAAKMDNPSARVMSVKMWENDDVWALTAVSRRADRDWCLVARFALLREQKYALD